MSPRQMIITLAAFAGLCTAIHLLGAGDLLAYRTGSGRVSAIVTAFTSHLTHWSTGHLAWDLGAFTLIVAFLQRVGVTMRAFWSAVVIAAIAIPLSVSAWTDLSSYRGLSGIDSAIFALLATHLIVAARRERDRLTMWVASVAFAGFVAKVIAELAGAGPLFASDLGGASPVPIAHLVGAAIGSIIGLVGGRESLPAPHASHLRRRCSAMNERVRRLWAWVPGSHS